MPVPRGTVGRNMSPTDRCVGDAATSAFTTTRSVPCVISTRTTGSFSGPALRAAHAVAIRINIEQATRFIPLMLASRAWDMWW
ncbi:MAG: hypothetical protein NVSMB57_01730 [Actinomycetota bacterium]